MPNRSDVALQFLNIQAFVALVSYKRVSYKKKCVYYDLMILWVQLGDILNKFTNLHEVLHEFNLFLSYKKNRVIDNNQMDLSTAILLLKL